MEPRILRQIDLTHTTCADLGDDAVMSDDRVGGYAFAQILLAALYGVRGKCLIQIIPADSVVSATRRIAGLLVPDP